MRYSRSSLGILLATLGLAFFLTLWFSVLVSPGLDMALTSSWLPASCRVMLLFRAAPWFGCVLASGFLFIAAYPTSLLISYVSCRTISWCSFRICAWSFAGAALPYSALWVWIGGLGKSSLLAAASNVPWLLLGLLAVWAGAKLATVFQGDVRPGELAVRFEEDARTQELSRGEKTGT